MKTIVTGIAAALLATAFAVSADAAGTNAKKKETTVSAAKAASCKAEAKKRYSIMHPFKRQAYEKKCMGTA